MADLVEEKIQFLEYLVVVFPDVVHLAKSAHGAIGF